MTYKNRLIELLTKKQDYGVELGVHRAIIDNDVLADYLIANGAIFPPCKVGDVLYEICERRRNNKWEKVIAKRVVHGIEIGLDGLLFARCGTTIIVPLSGLGKTVFLTREEAEKALERSKGNETNI